MAEKFFDQTVALHGLGPAERRVLVAGALLHDIGYTISEAGHHKHAQDLILGYELPGFSERERLMIACLARYHRKALPRPSHRVFCDLTPAEQDAVLRLSAVLRIADGLDRVHDAAVGDLSVERRADTVLIHAALRKPSPMDLWGAERKRDLFEEVFGVRVEVIGEPIGNAKE